MSSARTGSASRIGSASVSGESTSAFSGCSNCTGASKNAAYVGSREGACWTRTSCGFQRTPVASRPSTSTAPSAKLTACRSAPSV
jgi:hypothetical protein